MTNLKAGSEGSLGLLGLDSDILMSRPLFSWSDIMPSAALTGLRRVLKCDTVQRACVLLEAQTN